MIASIVVAAALATGAPPARAPAATCPATTPAALGQVVQAMYEAVAAGDEARARGFMDPGFQIFEGGVRMDATQILGLLMAARARGQSYRWSVNAPEGRIGCPEAWIAYRNTGQVTDAQGTRPLSWLETAALHYDGAAWKIVFMQSTRVPDPK